MQNPHHTSQAPDTPRLDDIITPDELATKHPEIFTENRIRWLIRNRDNNGLAASGSVIQVGKSYCLVEPIFVGWFLTRFQA